MELASPFPPTAERRRRWVIIRVEAIAPGGAAVLLLLASCSGESGGPTRTTTTSVPAAALQVLRVDPSCGSAPSVDGAGQVVHYEADLVIDGRADTAWRCEGDAFGQSLRFTLIEPAHVSSVGILPGYDKVDATTGADRWTENRRVTLVAWQCLAPIGEPVQQRLQDVRAVQSMDVDFPTCSEVSMTVLAASPPGTRDFTAIGEVVLVGTPAEPG
jgi:hypothetical protein